MPQEPRKKAVPTPPVIEEAATEEAVVEEDPPPKREEAKELQTRPPEGVEVEFTVLDREKNYRACIAKDGTCYNNLGNVFGYLNFETYEAGSVSEMLLGTCVENHFNNVIQVRDAEDELAGYLDMGTHTIRDHQGATVADFEAAGVLKHPNGSFLGQFEGARGYHSMRELTLYLVMLDPGMLSDIRG